MPAVQIIAFRIKVGEEYPWQQGSVCLRNGPFATARSTPTCEWRTQARGFLLGCSLVSEARPSSLCSSSRGGGGGRRGRGKSSSQLSSCSVTSLANQKASSADYDCRRRPQAQ